jgi:dTDP-4-amino-4,6-dideoxygalactose transaminase
MKTVVGGIPMSVPLVDLQVQYQAHRAEIDEAVSRVIESGRFIMGPEVTAFEEAFAAFIGSPSAVGVASGTAAVHLALLACDVGPGDEVITTPHTFIATAEAISHTGATPVFVDIDPATYTLDPARLENAITPKTKAIVPVHLYGHPADMGPLLEIAGRRGLFVVEDAAQAHGAEADGRRVGTLGHLAAFSFFPGKNLGAYGDAGAVTGTSAELLGRVRKLRDHGRISKYEHDEIGYGERLDALQAAILSVKLRYLEGWTQARRRIAARYTAGLAETSLELPIERPGARHVYHLYVVRSRRRDQLLRALNDAGVGAGIHYPVPLHRQPAYREMAGLSFPNTERAASEILSLPIFPEMRDDQLDYVIDRVVELSST